MVKNEGGTGGTASIPGSVQPTPVYLPGTFHGQKSLEGYSPQGHKELDKTEPLSMTSFTYLFIFIFWLCWILVAVCGLSLVAQSKGCSLVVVHGHLIAVASLVAQHRLWTHGFQQLQHAGSVVVAHGLSCSTACGIFLDERLNQSPLHWQADSYPPCQQGS